MNYEKTCRAGVVLALSLLAVGVALCVKGWLVGGLAVLVVTLTVVGVVSSKIAFWLPRRHGVRILMFHSVNDKIVDPAIPNLSVRPSELEALIVSLKSASYSFLRMEEVMTARDSRAVALTFDDGHKDNFTELFPILKRHQVPATIYMTNCSDSRFLTDAQVRELVASGLVEIGGHTVGHVPLTRMADDAERLADVSLNRKRLRELTGQPVTSFAFPCGYYVPSDINIIKEAGYLNSVTIKKRGTMEDPYQLPRQIIPRGLSPFEAYMIATRGRYRL